MTLLAIDIGNTRLKWALYSSPVPGSEPVAHGARFLETIDRLGEAEWDGLAPPPRRVLGCCVASDSVRHQRQACIALPGQHLAPRQRRQRTLPGRMADEDAVAGQCLAQALVHRQARRGFGQHLWQAPGGQSVTQVLGVRGRAARHGEARMNLPRVDPASLQVGEVPLQGGGECRAQFALLGLLRRRLLCGRGQARQQRWRVVVGGIQAVLRGGCQHLRSVHGIAGRPPGLEPLQLRGRHARRRAQAQREQQVADGSGQHRHLAFAKCSLYDKDRCGNAARVDGGQAWLGRTKKKPAGCGLFDDGWRS